VLGLVSVGAVARRGANGGWATDAVSGRQTVVVGTRCRLWLGYAVALVFIAGCAGDEHCPGGQVDDPGTGAEPDLFGHVEHPATAGAIDVGGVVVLVGSRTRINDSCGFVDETEQCFAFIRRGNDGEATEIWYFSRNGQPKSNGEFATNTGSYRIEGATVVLDGGIELDLDEDFQVHGCDSDDDADGLMRARFGATFYIDATTGRVNQAGCNGCM